ncbi:MAG: protein NO VEIN domain-containing protein, partial [Ktedonobacterales bacterium]
LQLTASGMAVALEPLASLRLRVQLRDMLLFAPPSWIGLVDRGRSSVRRYANRDTVQCFQDAGLLTEADPVVASWWDEVANHTRLKRQKRLLEIGRQGEWLSMEYEEHRVGRRPHWMSLDSTDAGYDLISLVERGSEEPLVIEVKASEEPWEFAYFHLSRNEWAVLSAQRHAMIHLWSLAFRHPFHHILDIKTLAAHIPNDMGTGKWEAVRVPFQVAGSGAAVVLHTSSGRS